MSLIVHDTNAITEGVIGAAIEVHRRLGPGLLESAYQACLARELETRGIGHQKEVVIPLHYRGMQLEKAYVMDILVENKVIIEVKAVEKLVPIHQYQLLTHLRLTSLPVGLLINFNVRVLRDGLRRLLC